MRIFLRSGVCVASNTLGCPQMRISCLMTGGKDFKIRVAGKEYRFEFKDCVGYGPAVLTKRDDIAASQPTAFLNAASLWHKQGRRIRDGYCVWRNEPVEILTHMGGKHYLVSGHQEQEDQW